MEFAIKDSDIELHLGDIILIMIITILSISVRVRSVHHPNSIVFDETYFGNFTNDYIEHEFYQDIHPPFAKLLMYKIAEAGEYDGHLSFSGKTPYTSPEYTMLRLTPGLFSSFVPPLCYLCVRFLGFSKSAAFTSGIAATFETTLIAEGRHILTDGILHFFSILHVTVLLYLRSLKRRDFKFWVWHALTGITLGLACAIKNTAWGLMMLDAFVYLKLLWPEAEVSMDHYIRQVLFYGSTLFLINFLVFWSTYIFHFLALPFIGPSTPFTHIEVTSFLVKKGNSSLLRPRIDPPNLLIRTLLYIYITHRGNMRLGYFHESQSHPDNWPLMTGVGVFFYHNCGRELHCLGNIFCYYFAFIGYLSCCFAFKKPQKWEALFIAVGYSFSYFPFYLIPRTLYLYHYCIPLMIGIVGYGAFLDIYLPPKTKGIVIVLSIALLVYFYWLISPLIYALPLRDERKMFWDSAWRFGDKRHRLEKSLNKESK